MQVYLDVFLIWQKNQVFLIFPEIMPCCKLLMGVIFIGVLLISSVLVIDEWKIY